MTWVAGVDGCPAGWCVVLREIGSRKSFFLGPISHVSEVLTIPESPTIVAVDIPIGLLRKAEHGGRECDRLARELLKKRGCCVFSPPARTALAYSENYPAANEANRKSSAESIGVSRQAFALFPKLRQVDEWIDAEKQRCVREVHPELCFFEMNDHHPFLSSKKDVAGRRDRRKILHAEEFCSVIEEALGKTRRKEVAEEDILDACAACWTGERIAKSKGICLPLNPPKDDKGLRMEIWR